MNYAKSLIKHNNGTETRLGMLGKVFHTGSSSPPPQDEDDEETKTDDSWMVV